MTDGLSAADVLAMTKEGDGMNAIWNNPEPKFQSLQPNCSK